MIYDGICPKFGCGGRLLEATGFRVPGGGFNQNPKGFLIKTKCIKCGRLIGYRPVRLKHEVQEQDEGLSGPEATGGQRQKRSRGRVPKVSKGATGSGDQRDLLV